MFFETMIGLTPELTNALSGGLIGGLLVTMAGMMVLTIIMGVAIYVYTSLAWFTIAKKLKYKKAWLAWIPLANFFLLPILAKKCWKWGFIILLPIILTRIPIIGPILTPISAIFITIMAIIWTWEIYTKRNYPGWLSLIPILSFVPLLNVFTSIAQLVAIGLVAWSNRK